MARTTTARGRCSTRAASNGRGEVTPSKSTAVVRGLQAKVRHVRVRTTVTWGPIDGNYWDVESNRLDGPAALEFANAVGVVEGCPPSNAATRWACCCRSAM